MFDFLLDCHVQSNSLGRKGGNCPLMSVARKIEAEGVTHAPVELQGSCCTPTPQGTSQIPNKVATDSFGPLAYFESMVDHCLTFAEEAKRRGKPIVGIMCEFTPRELILAAGGVPVCLCGGSAATVAVAEQELPPNLCPLIKSTFGYHLKRSNPFLEMADLVVAETTCDGKKKMFELMGAERPMWILALPPQSSRPLALEQWTLEVRQFKTELEKRFNVTITDAKLRSAIEVMNRERRLRRQLADWMTAEVPPLTGRQLLEFKSIISGIPADLEQYEHALGLLQSGVAAPGSPRASGRRGEKVRVLMTGVPMVHGAEHVLEWIEGSGAVVVALENCTGLKPILEDVDLADPDPIRALAAKYYHLPCSVMTPNERRFELLGSLAARFRPHCVIELVWQACLTYDVESARTRKLVEEKLGIPYLKITTDYSPSEAGRIKARVEALVELVRASGCRAHTSSSV
jgi:benzoyl-CoA reductase/2-hydroxyglutaryl-CoA dehydratase subunit BcrC/BadD/HgdB